MAPSRPRSACVFIARDGRVAALHHAVRGAPEVPGGKLEPGETIRACAARECREEVGVSPLRLRVLFEVEVNGHAATVFAARCAPDAELRGSREGAAFWIEPAALVELGTFRRVNARALQMLGLWTPPGG